MYKRQAINEHGQVVSVYNRLTCHEYVYEPAEIWKIIYSEGTERVEIPIWAQGQAFTLSLIHISTTWCS